jgi:hypothetical protein
MKPSSTTTQQVERDIAATSTDEQAADHAAMMAAATAGAPGAPGTPATAEETEDKPKEPSAKAMRAAVLIVSIVQPLACFVVPSLAKAPQALWEPIPEGVAGVLDHYKLAEQIEGPWIGLAMCCVPLAAFAAAESMKEEPKPKPPERLDGPNLAAQAPTEAPGQKTVTFGAPAAEVPA